MMTSSKGVVLAPEIRQQMLRHARAELPNECCGLLIGKESKINRLVPMRSTPPAPDAYYMDPEQQIAVFTEMEKNGEELLGIYHSHPNGPPEPSGMDLQLAFHPGVIYFIVSLEKEPDGDIRAFMLQNGSFQPLGIHP